MSTFLLATCAHNALKVGRLGLYSSELAAGGGRDLRYFMPLFSLRVLIRADLLEIWPILGIGFIAIALIAILAIWALRRRRPFIGV